uniref:Uncharacterized protein n=1 Tax=Arundo donax TaxID=35708 RepID=A0A0A9HQZ4_ARUDO
MHLAATRAMSSSAPRRRSLAVSASSRPVSLDAAQKALDGSRTGARANGTMAVGENHRSSGQRRGKRRGGAQLVVLGMSARRAARSARQPGGRRPGPRRGSEVVGARQSAVRCAVGTGAAARSAHAAL